MLSVDGTGEYESTVIWKVKDGSFEPILSMYTSYGSLGNLYELTTLGLGFAWLEGPGKGMGLTPYGERSKYYDKLREFVKIDPEGDEPYAILVNGKKVKTKDWDKSYSIYSYIAETVIGGRSLNWNPGGSSARTPRTSPGQRRGLPRRPCLPQLSGPGTTPVRTRLPWQEGWL